MSFWLKKNLLFPCPQVLKSFPVPSNQKITEENKTNNIKSLITNKKISDKKIKNAEVDKNFEQSIIDKIKK
jgi:hypothetical protein